MAMLLKFLSKNYIGYTEICRIIALKAGLWKGGNARIVFDRAAVISNGQFGVFLLVYNGLKFKRFNAKYIHNGFKYGEFIFTRKQFFFKKKGKKDKVRR